MRISRPNGPTRCVHCGRRRLAKNIEWHPGIEVWQCTDFTDCDRAQALKKETP